MKILDTVWTRANCELLRNWWEIDGKTAPAIAAEFGKLGYRLTKNAVIGKVNRMGLHSPETKPGMSRAKRSAHMRAANVMKQNRPAAFLLKPKKVNPKPPPEPPISATNPPKGKKAILLKHSKEGQCKAIIGYINGKLENAVYCGEKTPPHRTREGRLIDTNWCPYHASIYFVGSKR